MSKEKNQGIIIGVLIGGLVGAATALLFAPKPGSELRKDLVQAYRDLEEKRSRLMAQLTNKQDDEDEHSTAELLDRAQALYNEAMESSAKLLQQIKQTQSSEASKKGNASNTDPLS